MAEVLGALVNAVFLVALCFSITVESLKRFYEPEEIHNPQMILWVGTMGLIVNLIGLCLFHQHGSGHGHSHGLSRSTHSHLTDLADKEEKDENPEIAFSGKDEKKKNGHGHGHGGHGHSHGGHGHSHGPPQREPSPEERAKLRQKLHAKWDDDEEKGANEMGTIWFQTF